MIEPDGITYYSYEPVEPILMPIKEGDKIRVIQTTPNGTVERIYTAGPPVYSDDALKVKQTYFPFDVKPPYEVVE